MIANDMYNIELPSDEQFLSNDKNLMMTAIVFQQAISKYLSTYNKKEIPLTFFEFYLSEIKNYSYMFRKQTKDFFDVYEQVSPNFEILARVYTKSYYAQDSQIKNISGELYLVLSKNYVTNYIDDMTIDASKDIVAGISNIKKITDHINSSDEIIPFYKAYENYMISKIVRKQEFGIGSDGKSKVILNIFNDDDRPQIISATKHAERLTSERINVNKKRGKVTKIIIPKLKLPTTYPKSSTLSRFDSKYVAKNFISASREILIMNDLKINGVAYSDKFVEKRKMAINENT